MKTKKNFTTSTLLIVLLINLSCDKKNSVPKINLGKINNTKTKKISKDKDALKIKLIDNSLIYFENYHKLKFDIIVNENFEKFKDLESIELTCEQVGRNEIHTKKYSSKDVSDIREIFKNKYSKRNLYSIINNFNASEFWNLYYTIIKFSEYIKDTKQYTFDKLIIRHSEFQNGERTDSIATKRIELLRDYFNEEGMQKAWNKQEVIVDASNLVKKINFILKK